jgi:Transglutaminase elicitor
MMRAMSTATILLALAGVVLGEAVPSEEVKKQDWAYQDLWNKDFVWKFDDLPLKGGVETERIPYSGYIYPDKKGGTIGALRKYDRAFNGGRLVASAHEKWDTSAFKEPVDGMLGSFFKIQATPGWYGHCNGWTSAAIRHAEPTYSVTKNDVTFSPSDIKALLAEMYIYNEHIVLAGENKKPVGAAAFHAIITNWIGRDEHPLGMEAEPGEEKWNYPAYSFAASAVKRSDRQVEVTMNVAYAMDSSKEWDESPRFEEVKYFHYTLDLDPDGRIVGGRFLHDSSEIDMLWVPLRPKPSGEFGNESGNPYINIETILSLWRESVPTELRSTWVNVDPTEIIDRDRQQSPVLEVVVADADEATEAELVVPTRVVSRTFTTRDSPVMPVARCYGTSRRASTLSFDQLLHQHSTGVASRPAEASTVR